MDKKRFAKIRAYLGKTQKQMAQLMGTSTKAIESFEQGWRNISPHIERQLYFLLSQKTIMGRKKSLDCWVIRKCPEEKDEKSRSSSRIGSSDCSGYCRAEVLRN
jgi:DNA-binding XRE family transcriptional regulator